MRQGHSPYPILLMVRQLDIGGCERDLTRLAIQLDRQRFTPHVGCVDPEGVRGREIRAAGVPIVKFPMQSFVSWECLRGAYALHRYCRQHEIRLIHAFDMPMDIFTSLVRPLPGRPRLLHSHLWHRGAYSPRYQSLLRGTDYAADAAVVNSGSVRDELVKHGWHAPERTFLCYNGIDLETFHPEGRQRRPEVRDAALVVGALCALRPEKRLDVLLRAFAATKPVARNHRLLMVGSGTERESLQQLARELGIEGACVWIPAPENVVEWLRSMDVFVLCSETESFPNALLEAMACGCAAMGSAVGGVPEMIEDGVNGLLFPAGDVAALARGLERLAAEPRERQAMGEAAARAARDRFTQQINLQRMTAIYEAIIEKRDVPQLPANYRLTPA